MVQREEHTDGFSGVLLFAPVVANKASANRGKCEGVNGAITSEEVFEVMLQELRGDFVI